MASFVKGRWGQRPSEDAILDFWRKQGYFPLRFNDNASRIYDRVSRPMEQSISVVAGETVFEVGGRRHALYPGDELIIPAGMEYSARSIVPSQWVMCYLGSGEKRYERLALSSGEHSHLSGLHVKVLEARDVVKKKSF
eukprot:NODE_2230_length_1257_cov_36.787252_g2031_i0.p1 GENE.NODE_2230_length_1257_cov_36.787252_g2031_i0~~NODE_2230_length_1257_cov_36.787252_g2031_i0.p1  ORF type:complete len:138 (+),score=24.16 NODE_2230_length_1257_cov_36.787252_g2031_i0:82-495(+)